jgi:hypothetical protein
VPAATARTKPASIAPTAKGGITMAKKAAKKATKKAAKKR